MTWRAETTRVVTRPARARAAPSPGSTTPDRRPRGLPAFDSRRDCWRSVARTCNARSGGQPSAADGPASQRRPGPARDLYAWADVLRGAAQGPRDGMERCRAAAAGGARVSGRVRAREDRREAVSRWRSCPGRDDLRLGESVRAQRPHRDPAARPRDRAALHVHGASRHTDRRRTPRERGQRFPRRREPRRDETRSPETTSSSS